MSYKEFFPLKQMQDVHGVREAEDWVSYVAKKACIGTFTRHDDYEMFRLNSDTRINTIIDEAHSNLSETKRELAKIKMQLE